MKTPYILATLFVLVLIAVIPVFTILSLNTLFGTGIDFTVGTWFASMWLSTLVAGTVAHNKK